MLPRCGFDRPLEKYRVVTRQHRIVNMHEVDLELRWRELGGRRICRYALSVAIVVQVVKK
jgi:hypothetical protein